MPYTEAITRDGNSVTVTVGDAHALTALRRGQRLGATVTAAKDGTVTITRTALRFGDTDGETRGHATAVTLRPTVKQARLTKVQYEDLERIAAARGNARMRDGRIACGVWGIPPAAAKRLLERGLAVISEADGSVALGVAGLLAMAAHKHQPWTCAGSQEVGGGFEHFHTITGARQRDYGYFASAHCTCHALRHTGTDRASAQRAARVHLEQNLTASLNGA